jgi:hypothetical protein
MTLPTRYASGRLALVLFGISVGIGCTAPIALEVSTKTGITTMNCSGDCNWRGVAVRCEDGCSCIYEITREGVTSTEDGLGADSNVIRIVNGRREVTCLGKKCRLMKTDAAGVEIELSLDHFQILWLADGERIGIGRP